MTVVCICALSSGACVSAEEGRSVGVCQSTISDDVSINADHLKGRSLQVIYIDVVPMDMEAITKESISKTEAKITTSGVAGDQWQAGTVGDLFYAQQVEGLTSYCHSSGFSGYSKHDAAVTIEGVYAAVVEVAGLREMSDGERQSQLPSSISPNLTARVGFIEMSAFCSKGSTPQLDAVLKKVGMKCEKP